MTFESQSQARDGSTSRLRIAIQSKGRMSEGSLQLLDRTGLKFRRGRDDLLMRGEDMPVDVLLVRDDDIAHFVADGVCELGVVGLDTLTEDGLDAPGKGLEIVMALGFGRCALKIAVPSTFSYNAPVDLSGMRIATSFPQLLRRFLDRERVPAAIVEMSGSVEVAPRLHLAQAICDLVSTGATLEANGLKAVETVFESEVVLVRSTRPLPSDLATVRDRFLKRLEGVVATKGAKYIMLNAPKSALDAITELLPGAGAPTIMPLAGRNDAVAVHAVCQESVFWETLERLKAAGASAILVLPIEKMML
jgi:ATP phosphoribosyltransferase